MLFALIIVRRGEEKNRGILLNTELPIAFWPNILYPKALTFQLPGDPTVIDNPRYLPIDPVISLDQKCHLIKDHASTGFSAFLKIQT